MSYKLFGLASRRPGMSVDDFHDHWRHPHGTWARRMTTLLGYVQSHQIDTPFLPVRQSRFEAFPECWLETLTDIANFRDEPILREFLIPDEPRFIGPDGMFLATREEIIIDGPHQLACRLPGDEFWTSARPLSTKLLHFLAPDDMTPWSSAALEDVASALQAIRCVRCVPLDEIHELLPFRGVLELWWPTRKAFKEGVGQAARAFARLIGSNDAAVTALVQAERLL